MGERSEEETRGRGRGGRREREGVCVKNKREERREKMNRGLTLLLGHFHPTSF